MKRDPYIRKAQLIRCVDGDTADFLVDLGFYTFHRIRGRFLGFDTPERGQPGFSECHLRLAELLIERQIRDRCLTIKTTKTGKYGRWLVEVLEPEGSNAMTVEEQMVKFIREATWEDSNVET